jgi:hypothetical protein
MKFSEKVNLKGKLFGTMPFFLALRPLLIIGSAGMTQFCTTHFLKKKYLINNVNLIEKNILIVLIRLMTKVESILMEEAKSST